MSFRRWVLPITLLLGAACRDGIAPPAPSAVQPHLLRWAGAAAPGFRAIGAVPGGQVRAVAPAVDAYQASFWAVRGESRSIQLNYLQQDTSGDAPFLVFTATDPTYVPGIGDLAPGDSVLITVEVDSENVAVRFGPSGLQFGEPATLTIWYHGVDGDLNGDGVVDSTDADIESQLLGLWYREDEVSPWAPMAYTKSLTEQWFTTSVPHFTEFAVAW